MTRYEYQRVGVGDKTAEQRAELLEKMGEGGWRLIATDEAYNGYTDAYIFERQA